MGFSHSADSSALPLTNVFAAGTLLVNQTHGESNAGIGRVSRFIIHQLARRSCGQHT